MSGSIKNRIISIVGQSLVCLSQKGLFVPAELTEYMVEVPREKEHGDFTTNVALTLARSQKKPPREIAAAIVKHLDDAPSLLDKVEVAGPGFINFFVSSSAWQENLRSIVTLGNDYGKCSLGQGRRVQVEFVSANPTGPLHVGHGRGAAVGDALANILAAAGYEVEREYYINDAGTQMETLGHSMWLRCRELMGETITIPENYYQGEYIRDLAVDFLKQPHAEETLASEERALPLLGQFAAHRILDDIKVDLEDFGVKFNHWFSEKEFVEKGVLEDVYRILRERDLLYEQDGAVWFRSSRFGDEKDRVLVRSTGAVTYFATDIAYHWNKINRDFDLIVDVWGADHHGYVPRLRASLDGLGGFASRLRVLLVQLVNLVRGGVPVAMSTRKASFVTLREVLDEVGKDVARFIFLSRRCDAHLDFDLDLAKQQTNENPVFYVQYAHARIASVLRLAEEQGIHLAPVEEVDLTILNQKEEMRLIKQLDGFPEEIEVAAKNLEPHRITYYLGELVANFHRFYHEHRIISDRPDLAQARLALIRAVRIVIKNGLHLLGVSAPEQM
jgi:arginyl-tRNA synthetase